MNNINKQTNKQRNKTYVPIITHAKGIKDAHKFHILYEILLFISAFGFILFFICNNTNKGISNPTHI